MGDLFLVIKLCALEFRPVCVNLILLMESGAKRLLTYSYRIVLCGHKILP